ncbi:MAG: membrane-bound lytic murein transglycosylase MltF [Spirochaetaceae bacterium]
MAVNDLSERRIILITTLLAVVLSAIILGGSIHAPDTSVAEIQEAEVLRFVTQNNAHTYYIYRGEPAGFEFDLANAFADHLGVELEIVTAPWSELFSTLKEGEGDVLGASITATEEREEHVAFSEGHMVVRQEVIVHASNRRVRDLTDLVGLDVHVRSGTSYEARLRELQSGGLRINLVLHEDIPTEELIRRVAEREIEVTVADTNIALLNRRYYPDVRLAFSISAPQLIAWAVQPEDERLLEEINSFFRLIKENGTYQRIYDRYYDNVEVFDYFDIKLFHRRISTRLPNYVKAIKREADRYGFDWRLIAAMAYQESHYHPVAMSYTGVQGLMQVTMTTAEEMGIDNRLDPEQSIHAGVKYLSILCERFSDIPNPRDRLLFSLAAYNVGYGHVRDAQGIAQTEGLPPDRWSSLERVLPLLRQPEYYRETVHGYARGTEPVRYVNRILTYYDILRRQGADS